ncbi:type II secretion system F family protein [Streptomyces tubbatahanensis]|uniref:Type II secretion system F family protein n=1 Tax=Streptomyces tubbatahanensis TaxID=2923272 RepID=A0ABY3XV33_9ACTN|nr:type II secretion system F family protein [Streptomyces tubbatahanensis]UNS98166.1 type II secretion system F family protein [Streptomyces tubbatahanensis]
MDVVPRLWMWVLASAALLGAAGCVTGVVDVTRREGRVRQRAWSACGHGTEGRPGGRLEGGPDQRGSALLSRIRRAGNQAMLSRRARERVGMAGAGVVALLLIGGQVGWLAGGAAAWGMRWWLRRGAGEDASRSAKDRAAEEQLPLAADLMAACLAAGAGPERAAEAVGGSVGGPLGERLVKASTELRLGAEPALVWGRFAERPWGVEFARCMERAADAGVPAVESVARLAAELRARWIRAANGRARRAAVLVTGPLGLCFLPAFLAIGVAPVLLGLARTLW